MPANWKEQRSTVENGETIGHDEYSRTIALHSLAVLPEHQGKQVGSTLLKSYIQRIREAGIADRIVIIAHDNLIPFYEGFGFENRGPSECKHGGGGWYDLVRNFFRLLLFAICYICLECILTGNSHWISQRSEDIFRWQLVSFILHCLVVWTLMVAFLPSLSPSLFPLPSIHLLFRIPFFFFFFPCFLSSGWFCLQGCFKRPKATEFCAGSVLGYNDQLYDVRDEQGDYLM